MEILDLRVYTDGACTAKKIGGWAYILICEYKNKGVIKRDLRAYRNAGANMTNQKAELMAVLSALKNFTKPAKFTICSDSAYIVNCMQQGWYKKWLRNGWRNSSGDPVANQELWMQVIHLADKHEVTFEKVKGHNGDQWNELADELAKQAIIDYEDHHSIPFDAGDRILGLKDGKYLGETYDLAPLLQR